VTANEGGTGGRGMRASTAMSQTANMIIPPSSEPSTRTSAINIAGQGFKSLVSGMRLTFPITKKGYPRLYTNSSGFGDRTLVRCRRSQAPNSL